MTAVPPAFGIVGVSGAGKTSLIIRLIDHFNSAGLIVATVKSTHHDVDLDPKAKDSARHRAAGAKAVALIGPKRTHLIVEAPLNLAEILALFHGVDLVLVEGLSQADIPKLEVHRPSLQQPLRALNANRLAAIASDAPVDQSAVPVLNLGDIPAIADFIRHQVGL